jgi:hypothetical protein
MTFPTAFFMADLARSRKVMGTTACDISFSLTWMRLPEDGLAGSVSSSHPIGFWMP